MERLAQVVEGDEDFSPAPAIAAPEGAEEAREPDETAPDPVVIEAEPVEAEKPKDAKPEEKAADTEARSQKPAPQPKPVPVNGLKTDASSKDEPVKPPLPDDPGVDPDDKNGSTQSPFRLF
jgi:HemY protein